MTLFSREKIGNKRLNQVGSGFDRNHCIFQLIEMKKTFQAFHWLQTLQCLRAFESLLRPLILVDWQLNLHFRYHLYWSPLMNDQTLQPQLSDHLSIQCWHNLSFPQIEALLHWSSFLHSKYSGLHSNIQTIRLTLH